MDTGTNAGADGIPPPTRRNTRGGILGTMKRWFQSESDLHLSADDFVVPPGMTLTIERDLRYRRYMITVSLMTVSADVCSPFGTFAVVRGLPFTKAHKAPDVVYDMVLDVYEHEVDEWVSFRGKRVGPNPHVGHPTPVPKSPGTPRQVYQRLASRWQIPPVPDMGITLDKDGNRS